MVGGYLCIDGSKVILPVDKFGRLLTVSIQCMDVSFLYLHCFDKIYSLRSSFLVTRTNKLVQICTKKFALDYVILFSPIKLVGFTYL